MTRAASRHALALALLLGAVAPAHADEPDAEDGDQAPHPTSRIAVSIEVLPSGRLHFREEIRLDLLGEKPPPLTLEKGAFPAPAHRARTRH